MNEKNKTESIVFGGGCFWCIEAVFQMLRGVRSVTSGYAGGATDGPTYEEVCAGKSGHAEVVKVDFDSNLVKLEDLLNVFFTSHDPTTLNRQGADIGTQYRSVIYFTAPEQRIAIEDFISKLEEERIFSNSIITEVKPLPQFFPAEGYHQNYYLENVNQPYCQVVINPKIAKLRQRFAHLLQDAAVF